MNANRATFLMGTAAVAVAGLPRLLRAQTAPALTTIRLGTAGNDDATPIVYAQKMGIFAKYGLDVQINKNPGPAAAALVGGSYDFGKSAITSLLQAHENGLPLNVVAGASQENFKVPYAAFLMKKESPAQSGKDFEGKTIGLVVLKGIGEVAMRKFVDENGGDQSTLTFVEVPTFTAAGAVDAGRVYASECTYPAIQVGLDTGRMKTAPLYSELGDGSILTAWAVTRDFSTAHPDVVRAFARAWKESSTYTNGHHDVTVDMMSQFTAIPAEVIAKMPRATASPSLTPAQFQTMIDACAKYGALKHSFPAADLIDPNVR